MKRRTTATMNNLTDEQRKLVEEILRREDPQRKVDLMLMAHKFGLNLSAFRSSMSTGGMNLR